VRELLVLGHDDVRALLSIDACIEAMRRALTCLAEGQVHQPLRLVVRPPQIDGLIALMPSYLGGNTPAFGFKAVSVFHDNPKRGKDVHQGVVLLVSVETGEPLALLDASAITLVRTAAATAVATDVLARKDARTLAIIGAGTQARAHLLAIAKVRALQEVRVAGRASAEQFVAEMAPQIDVRLVAANVRDAVRGADIVVTATSSSTPVLEGEWLEPGMHVNAIGACLPHTREVDGAAIARSRLYCDRRESLLNEAGDFLLAQKEGAVTPQDVQGEIGEVLIGKVPGRTSPDEITLFKSLGMSVEDLAAAQLVLAAAQQAGVGTRVRF
jgi:ornithine cyclodeaminase